MRRLIPGLLMIAAAAGFSVWAWPNLPAEVATHFDMQGDPNGWSSRLVAALLVPGIGLALLAASLVMPRIDPRRANYELFTPTYWTVVNAVLLLLLGIHVLSLGRALGWNVNASRVASLGVGGILLVLGNLMTRVRPNWFIGVRTPWTLSSDTVWRKTHRFAGAGFMLAGVCFVGSAIVDAGWTRYGAIGATIAAGLGAVVYSYVAWKHEQESTPPAETAAKV